NGVPVAPDGGKMRRQRPALDTTEVTSPGIGAESEIRDAAGFPEPNRVAPGGFIADTRRHPGVDSDLGWITAGRLGIPAHLVDRRLCLIARCIAERHPTIAPPGDPAQRGVSMASEPNRNRTPRGQRIDPGVLD